MVFSLIWSFHRIFISLCSSLNHGSFLWWIWFGFLFFLSGRWRYHTLSSQPLPKPTMFVTTSNGCRKQHWEPVSENYQSVPNSASMFVDTHWDAAGFILICSVFFGSVLGTPYQPFLHQAFARFFNTLERRWKKRNHPSAMRRISSHEPKRKSRPNKDPVVLSTISFSHGSLCLNQFNLCFYTL